MVKLYEFQVHRDVFNTDSKAKEKETNDHLQKDVMGYLLDSDELHKKHFLPTAWKLHKHHKAGKYDKEKVYEHYMDLVNEGCIAYYKEKKMQKDPNEIFPFNMRLTLAKQLAEIHHEPIAQGIFEGQQANKSKGS
jgi:hypothetical protein